MDIHIHTDNLPEDLKAILKQSALASLLIAKAKLIEVYQTSSYCAKLEAEHGLERVNKAIKDLNK